MNIYFKRKLFKQGNSLVVTIPLEIIEQLRLKEGKSLKVGMVGEDIIMEKWKK